jgi:hypothetical protein
MAERNERVKAKVFKNKPLTAKNLTALVWENIDVKNAILFTDEYKGYIGIKR